MSAVQFEFRLRFKPCSPDDAPHVAEMIQLVMDMPLRVEYDPAELTLTMSNTSPVIYEGIPNIDTIDAHFPLIANKLAPVLHVSGELTCEVTERHIEFHRSRAIGLHVAGTGTPPKERKRTVIVPTPDLF